MKLGIMADSHDNLPKVEKAIEVFNKEGVTIVLHAGDIVSPFTAKKLERLNCKTIAVFGNNDGEKIVLLERFKSLGEIHRSGHSFQKDGKKIIIFHEEPQYLPCLTKEFDLIIYGHSHKEEIRQENNTWIINPGETCGWLTGKSTVVIFDLDDKKPELIKI